MLPLLMLASLAAWTAAFILRHPRVIDPAAYEEEQRRFREVFHASMARHAEIMDRYALQETQGAGPASSIMPASPGRPDPAPSASLAPPSRAASSVRTRATAPSDTVTAASPRAPIDLNSAGMDELVTLPGVGPAIAQRILDWRKQQGRFSSVDQLLEVRGIGHATLGRLRPFVVVTPRDAPPQLPSPPPPSTRPPPL